MRGQGYDGAANMSGIHKGVQARVRQRFPFALYTHCKAHNLNLAIVHACKEPLIRNMMDTIQTITFGFDYSAKRTLCFEENLDADQQTKDAMERRTKLKTLCETRWFSRIYALSTFLKCFPVVIESLDELADDGDSKARSYSCSIRQFDFIITLVTAEHVLSPLNPPSATLQAKSLDLIEAVNESKVIIDQLKAERGDDSVWDALFDKAEEIARDNNIDVSMPRVVAAQRQRHRVNVPADNPRDYWKRAMYLPFHDHLIVELTDRLISNHHRFFAQYLIPKQLGQLTREMQANLYAAYGNDIPAADNQVFYREIQRWKIRWEQVVDDEKPATLADTLVSIKEPRYYPNIYRCLDILIAMPVTSASAERSFSILRRVKTYLRSTMKTTHLSSLALLHAYRDFDINLDTQ